MKKILMSLGFVAATIFAAQAQETTPQEGQQQQYPTEQTQPQEDQGMQEQDPMLEDENMQSDPTQDPAQQTTPPTEDPAMMEDPTHESDPAQNPTEDPAQQMQESDPAMEENHDMNAQESSKKPIEGEGITQIDKSALPQEVSDGLKNSEFQEATIENAYEVSGPALDQALGQESVEMYAGDQAPEKLYQLQVTHQDKPVVLYFTEEGELYASKEME